MNKKLEKHIGECASVCSRTALETSQFSLGLIFSDEITHILSWALQSVFIIAYKQALKDQVDKKPRAKRKKIK